MRTRAALLVVASCTWVLCNACTLKVPIVIRSATVIPTPTSAPRRSTETIEMFRTLAPKRPYVEVGTLAILMHNGKQEEYLPVLVSVITQMGGDAVIDLDMTAAGTVGTVVRYTDTPVVASAKSNAAKSDPAASETVSPN